MQQEHKDKQALAEVQGLIQKNRTAINECRALIGALLGDQVILRGMIEKYGINKAKESQRLKALMTGNRKAKGKPWTDVRSSEDRSVDTPAI